MAFRSGNGVEQSSRTNKGISVQFGKELLYIDKSTYRARTNANSLLLLTYCLLEIV